LVNSQLSVLPPIAFILWSERNTANYLQRPMSGGWCRVWVRISQLQTCSAKRCRAVNSLELLSHCRSCARTPVCWCNNLLHSVRCLHMRCLFVIITNIQWMLASCWQGHLGCLFHQSKGEPRVPASFSLKFCRAARPCLANF